MNKLQEIMNQSYDFPVDFKKRCKKADFVFVQDKSVDPFSGGGVLDRATMIEVNDNYMIIATSNTKIRADTHIFLGLPGFKGFVNAYVHQKIGKKLVIGCMSGYLVK